ncbi:hypothetical protein FBU30_000215 [Linnemannia zychae]|nr:hypothetical protein FBU30_000215 [Linnemannia zychae]
MAVVLPPAPTTLTSFPPPISTNRPTIPIPPKTTIPRASSSIRATDRSSTTSSLPAIPTVPNSTKDEGGMSGGAIAGLVIGALFLLVCSVVGGLILLKKRRKRMMGRGQYNGYSDTSRSRDLKQDDDASGESKSGLWGLVNGVHSKTQSLATPKSSKPASATVVATPDTTLQAHSTAKAMNPLPPIPTASNSNNKWGTMSSPPPIPMGNVVSPSTPVVGPNYGVNNGVGPNFLVPQENNTLISQPLSLPPASQDQPLTWQQQQQLQQQQFQQQQLQLPVQQLSVQQLPVQQLPIQQQPIQGYSAAMAPAVASQQQLHRQPHQQQQQFAPLPLQQQHVQRNMSSSTITTPVSQPYYYQPGTGLVSVPHALPPVEPYNSQHFQPKQAQAVTATSVVPYTPNIAHYSTLPVSVCHMPPPPPPSQQPIQQHNQQPMIYQQPPTAIKVTNQPPVTIASVPNATTRTPTPESESIFLPGDSSRLLLSQGLYKIVPDAEEEEEEARRAAAAVSATSAHAGSTSAAVMDLNLGGDFLSSVLNFSNQGPTNTFSSLSQGLATNIPAPIAAPVVNGGGQPVRQQPGYHDRQAGQKDRPNNQPRYLVDKEEYLDGVQGQNGSVTTAATSTVNTEPVIVGSDIVFEPLPSVKAARKKQNLTDDTNSRQSSSSSLLNNTNPSKEPMRAKPISSLVRAPTLGEMLPTMGTEEYLERTDDKEEYNAKLHGARELAGSPGPSTNIVHPTQVGELSKEAEGGIVDIGTPISPNAILPPSSPRSSTPTPPPLRLSTKPKFK